MKRIPTVDRIAGYVMVAMWLPSSALAPSPSLAAEPLPLVLRETFDHGAERWEPTDPSAWRIVAVGQGKGKAYELFGKSRYKPPYRSPLNIAWLKSPAVGDFELTVRVRSTTRDYPHRDVCLFFGRQDAGHFYYVHFGKRTDDHANQIFIVNGKPRTKISQRTSPGTPWTDGWHTLRIERRVKDGRIAVYFDDLDKPVMMAHDTTFSSGRIGIGSFDDTAQFAEVILRAKVVKR